MERVKLVVNERPEAGTRAARRLRKSGLIPGVLYGHGKPAVPFSVDARELRDALNTDAGLHAVLDVTLEGKKRAHVAVVKDYQLDHVKHVVTHLDLQEIRLDETIETSVALVAEGQAAGVKMGGILDLVHHEVNVQALPTDIPERIAVNVEVLEIGEVLHVSDIVPPENVRILDDPDTLVCTILAPRVIEVVEEEVEVAAAAEPELVGKEGEEAGEKTEGE